MSHNPSRYSSHPRQPSVSTGSSGLAAPNPTTLTSNYSSLPQPSSQQPPLHNPALVSRINEKREELQNLLELKELSANLAKQMEQLEEKLNTLADGTHAVAMVLSNWENVIRAIALASSKIPAVLGTASTESDRFADEPGDDRGLKKELPMPVPLVRIPTKQYL